MKLVLASVGSISLCAKVAWFGQRPSVELCMTSTLGGQPREIGMTLQADDLDLFKQSAHALLNYLGEKKS